MVKHTESRQDLAIKALLEVTQAINNTQLQEAELFRIYQFTLQGYLQLSRMALYEWVDQQSCVRQLPQTNRTSLPKQLEPILCQRLQNLHQPMPVRLLGLPSLFAAYDWVLPIAHQGKAMAHVFIDTREVLTPDLAFVQTLSNIVLVAVQNRRLIRQQIEQEALQRELELAQRVQRLLLPQYIPQQEHFDIAIHYQPHRNVGGDFYDLIAINPQELLLCIADVSGKGLAAALIMANFQASLRAIVKNTYQLSDIIHQLNELIYENTKGENFITVFLAHYHFGKKQLSYINAGHHPPYLFVQGRPIQALSRGTTVLGCFRPLPFIEVSVLEQVEKALLFAYTDGLAELTNPKGISIDLESIARYIAHHHQLAPHTLVEQVLVLADQFRQQAPFHDDYTAIICRFY